MGNRDDERVVFLSDPYEAGAWSTSRDARAQARNAAASAGGGCLLALLALPLWPLLALKARTARRREG